MDKTMTGYFDGALYINLDERFDKDVFAKAEFAKHNLTVNRISGIKGNPDNLPTVGKPGDVGCTLSHVRCVDIAKAMGWETVIIFEDDVEFRDNINDLFASYFLQVPSDWDMIYLGGNHWGRDLSMRYNPELYRVTPNVARTYHTLTTHAYAIKNTMYDAVIYYLGKANKQVDIMYIDLQQEFKVYAFRPSLAWQRPNISDINNKQTNYYFIKEW